MAHIIEMPKLSDTMEEGVIHSWVKKVGEFVEEGEVLAEIETDKATMDYASPEEGVLLKILVQPGQECQLNAPIAVLGEKGEEVDVEKIVRQTFKKSQGKEEKKPPLGKGESVEEKNLPVLKQVGDGRHRSSPLARKIAREKGFDIKTLVGTGPQGRVIYRDVIAATPDHSATLHPDKLNDFSGQDIEKPLTMMRKTIAKRLSTAKNEAPHFYLTRSCHMAKTLAWRERLNRQSEIKVSVNDQIILAVSRALKKHPEINSSWYGDRIVQRGGIHIAVAVALPEGLVTPVLENVDRMGVQEIAAGSREKITRAKQGQLSPDEYRRGTFTISNLGMMGIEEFTAIINPPQAAILAVGATQEVPWVEEGKIVVQPRMKMTMSCDHRVIDGAMGAQFLQTLVSFLEDPAMMLG